MIEADATVDASLFGIFYFGCFDADDEMVVSTMKAVEEKLSVKAAASRVLKTTGICASRTT